MAVCPTDTAQKAKTVQEVTVRRLGKASSELAVS